MEEENEGKKIIYSNGDMIIVCDNELVKKAILDQLYSFGGINDESICKWYEWAESQDCLEPCEREDTCYYWNAQPYNRHSNIY